MSDIHLDEVEVYSCCGMCKQLAPTRICERKWGLLGEFLHSYCFFVSFFLFSFSSFSFILYPFPVFLYLYVLKASPHKGLVLVHCLETVLVNKFSVEATGNTNE